MIYRTVYSFKAFHTWTQTHPKAHLIESDRDVKMAFVVENRKSGCDWFCLPPPISYITSAKKQFPSLVKTRASNLYTHFTESSDWLVGGHVTQTRLIGVFPQFLLKEMWEHFSSLVKDLIKYPLLGDTVHRLIDRVKLACWRKKEMKREKCVPIVVWSLFSYLIILEVWKYETATYWLLQFDIEYLSFVSTWEFWVIQADEF